MYLTITSSKNARCFYICESYRDAQGVKKSRTIQSLGSEESIRTAYAVEDAEAWCREYVRQKNEEAKKEAAAQTRQITVALAENLPKAETSAVYHAGGLILESLYHCFGMSNICCEIAASHPHVKGFSFDSVLKSMLLGRILEPSSKRRLAKKVQSKLMALDRLDEQHIYRAMDLLDKHRNLIQKRLYQYTSQALGGRNVSRLYYDCTNFYTETEMEDCDSQDKGEQWQEEHKLRRYGKSKENRPNPIVQMGLFMDGDGMPLGFCINPGNTNEQVTMKPLEESLLQNFNTSSVIVCTDNGLASMDNRRFNDHSAENDPLVEFGLRGRRSFICVQSVRGLRDHLRTWALCKQGWSYAIRDESGRHRVVDDFDLSSITPQTRNKWRDTLFFKERTIAEDGLDQRLIMTFSINYQEYLEALRERKVKRATRIIENGTYKREHENSPRNLISQTHTIKTGEEATKTTAKINEDKLSDDSQYDGFYCLATNIFKEEMSAQDVSAIGARRWEIEECFRILKTDLKARPIFHNKDSRIRAHFQTCFMALLLLRGIEQKISVHNGRQRSYPVGKYTMSQILDALRSINVISIADGKAWQPDYDNSELIAELLEIFDLKQFDRQVVMKDTMNKILKKIRTNPEMLKD